MRGSGKSSETFLRRLVGFAPLGCGFALTGSCPSVLEDVFELPDAFTSVPGQVPSVRPVAGVVTESNEAWRFLAPPADDEQSRVPKEWGMEIVGSVPPSVPISIPESPGTTEQTSEEAIVNSWRNGETIRAYEWATCETYVTYASTACADLRVDKDVSTFVVTECCATLRAARARGCLCAPLGSSRFFASNPDLPLVVPKACGIQWDDFPPGGDDSVTCRSTLTLAEVLAPAAAVWSREGISDDGESPASPDERTSFFDDRDVTLDSLLDVAEHATPIVVTEPATLVVKALDDGGDAQTDREFVLPLGSVVGVVRNDALPGDAKPLPDTSDASLEPGSTYIVPKEAVLVSEVTSVEDVVNPVLVAVTAGDVTENHDDVVVVTVPDPETNVEVPWSVTLVPPPVVPDAPPALDYVVTTTTLPSVVALRAPDGIATLVPVPPKEARDADPARVAAFLDAVAQAEGSNSVALRTSGGLVYAHETDVTGLELTTPGSTQTCLIAILVAESACIPVLEQVVDVFELDLNWRACCGKIERVAGAGCYCDGAAVRALEQTSRAAIHSRVVSAVKGACGIDVTRDSRDMLCPVARFAPADTDANIVGVATAERFDETATTETEDSPQKTTLVAVDAGLYVSDPAIVSIVTGSGGVHVAISVPVTSPGVVSPNDDAPRRPTPVLAVAPQSETPGVFVDANGSVSYQNAGLPGVTFVIDESGSSVDGITVLFRNGTLARVRLDETGDVAEAAFSVSPTGAFDVTFDDKEKDVTLAEGAAAADVLRESLGLDVVYDPATDQFKVTLPDGVVVTASASLPPVTDQSYVSDFPTDETDSGDTQRLTPQSGPSAGTRGVVVRDGQVVAPPTDGEPPTGVCSGIRELKNFLSTNMEPGATEFTVVGAVSCCSPTQITSPEVVIPIRYLPRGGSPGGVEKFAPPLSPPETECLGVVVVDVNGRFGPDLCASVRFVKREYGVDAIIENVDVCVDCSITGRVSDGAMFRVKHETSDTLLAMRPTIDRLECDATRVEAGEDTAGDSAVTAVETPEVSRPIVERPGGVRRKLRQFLDSVNAYSEPSEVDDFWNRLSEETGVDPQVSDDGDGDSGGSAAVVGTVPPADDRGGRYGLGRDGTADSIPRADTNGGAQYDDDDVPLESITFPDTFAGDGSIIVGCVDDVARLANDVQWWSRGAGPLEPGLPNEPYDEYVFAGSVDVLSGNLPSLDSAEQASVRLAGIVLPVVFSPWVLDASSSGDWRAVTDPVAELTVSCSGAATRLPDGTVEPRPETCGGLGFALSLFEPAETPADTETETAGTADSPAVLLLEVTFSGELCLGCRFVGGGARGEMFRVKHATGAMLDFVGPTVGDLECAPGGPVGVMVERVLVDKFDAATGTTVEDETSTSPADADASLPIVGFVAQGEDRETSECDFRKGVNLKGELLNDGGSLIKGDPEDCCWECANNPECNVWVYCAGDCGEYAFHSCWLKRAVVASVDATPDAWAANSQVPWTSGAFPPKPGVGLVATPVPTPTTTPEWTTTPETTFGTIPTTTTPEWLTTPELTNPDTTDPTPGTTPETVTPTPTPVATPTQAPFSEPPNIRVVPVGTDGVVPTPTPSTTPSTDPETIPETTTPETTPETTPSGTVPTTTTTTLPGSVTLVPGEPTRIPGSVITLLPGDGVPGSTETPTETDPTRTQPPSFSGPTQAAVSSSCDEDSVSVCPVLPSGTPTGTPTPVVADRDPLATANVRSSFQLLRQRAGDGDRDTRLTLLRPGDAVDQIFVTGTLINPGADSLCLSSLAVNFDFPRTVLVGNEVREAPAGDFVVRCFYVGVRSRSASAAPAAASASPNSASPAMEQQPAPPAACGDIVTLAMTPSGPSLSFTNDTSLCPGCWLVGGRDGVLFRYVLRFPNPASTFCRLSARNYCLLHTSQVDCLPIHGTCTLARLTLSFLYRSWRHKDGFLMTAQSGDAVGFSGASCS